MFAILAAVALTVGGIGAAISVSSDNQFLDESHASTNISMPADAAGAAHSAG